MSRGHALEKIRYCSIFCCQAEVFVCWELMLTEIDKYQCTLGKILALIGLEILLNQRTGPELLVVFIS